MTYIIVLVICLNCVNCFPRRIFFRTQSDSLISRYLNVGLSDLCWKTLNNYKMTAVEILCMLSSSGPPDFFPAQIWQIALVEVCSYFTEIHYSEYFSSSLCKPFFLTHLAKQITFEIAILNTLKYEDIQFHMGMLTSVLNHA